MTNPSPSRRGELSRLNVIFCLMVVAIHCLSWPQLVCTPEENIYVFSYLLQRLLHFSVQGFFLLSGVKLFLKDVEHFDYPRYYGKRAKSVVLPYVLAAVITVLFNCFYLEYEQFSVSSLLGQLVTGDASAQFYFIIALIQLILLAPLWRFLLRRYSPVILVVFALLVNWLFLSYLPDLLHLIIPNHPFLYNDRLFTSYLLYWLAGCCIGKYYKQFCALLKQNFSLIAVAWGCFTVLWCITGLACIHKLPAPFAEYVKFCYNILSILFFYALALRWTERHPAPSRWINHLDGVSYLIYLYHCLAVSWFNFNSWQWNISSETTLTILRLLFVYGVTIAACLLWRLGTSTVRRLLPHRKK